MEEEREGLMRLSGFARERSRPFAMVVLGLWVAPAMFLAVVVVVMSAKEYPAFALAAALAMLFVGLRVLRRRRTARATQAPVQEV